MLNTPSLVNLLSFVHIILWKKPRSSTSLWSSHLQNCTRCCVQLRSLNHELLKNGMDIMPSLFIVLHRVEWWTPNWRASARVLVSGSLLTCPRFHSPNLNYVHLPSKTVEKYFAPSKLGGFCWAWLWQENADAENDFHTLFE